MTTDTPAKFIYDVTIAPGLVIPVNGPEDISEEDLIAKAWTHPKAVAWQNKNKTPQTGTANSSQSNVDSTALSNDENSSEVKAGEMPKLSSVEDLRKTAQKGSEHINQNVAQPPPSSPFKNPSDPTTFDYLKQGEFSKAWDTIPPTVQTGIEIGAPIAALGTGFYIGNKLGDMQNKRSSAPQTRVEPTGGLPDGGGGGGGGESPPNNIKSRTFEAGNYGNQNIEVTAPETKMSPKEAQIAAEIKNKYGYDWGEVKTKYGLGDVPVNDMTQAEMVVNNLRNKEAASANTPSAPETSVSASYLQEHKGLHTPETLQKGFPGQTEWDVFGTKLNANQYAEYLNTFEAPEKIVARSTAPVEEIKPAPTAETPKAPAPPPENAPKAAVAPETIESKLGKPTATTGSGMPAYQGEGDAGSKVKHKKGTINSLNEIPKDMVFVPGGNYMDSVRNAVGQEAYTANLRSSGGYPASNEAAAAQSRQINASLNRPTREEAIAQGLPPKENTKSITQNVGGKKLVKVGGVTGALILASDLANAASKGDYGPIKEAGFDIGMGTVAGVLGGPAGIAAQQALMGTTLAPGVVSTDPRRETILARPGVNEYLEKLKKSLTPQQYNLAAERYLATNPNAPKTDWQKFVELNNQRTMEANTKLRAVPPPSMRR